MFYPLVYILFWSMKSFIALPLYVDSIIEFAEINYVLPIDCVSQTLFDKWMIKMACSYYTHTWNIFFYWNGVNDKVRLMWANGRFFCLVELVDEMSSMQRAALVNRHQNR